MTDHRCDPTNDPTNAPVTRARVFRMISAMMAVHADGDTARVQVELDELGGCPGCLTMALLVATGAAAELITKHQEPDGRMAVDLLVEAYDAEAAAAWEADG